MALNLSSTITISSRELLKSKSFNPENLEVNEFNFATKSRVTKNTQSWDILI